MVRDTDSFSSQADGGCEGIFLAHKEATVVATSCMQMSNDKGQENSSGMAVEWQGNGRGMAGEWQGNGRGMAGEWQWNGNGVAMAWQWRGNGVAMELQGCCNGGAGKLRGGGAERCVHSEMRKQTEVKDEAVARLIS